MHKLIYLHGLNSSPQSTKARLLGQRIASLSADIRPAYHVPALHHRPARAIADVVALIDRLGAERLTFVGSSLGGYYATYLAERYSADGVRAVLINPTTGPAHDLQPYLGPQRNLYSGDQYVLDDQHLAEFRALVVPRLTHPRRYYLMLQTGDEVLDYRRAIAHYAGAFQLILGGGDHAFADFDRHIDSILQFAGDGFESSACGDTPRSTDDSSPPSSRPRSLNTT